MTPSEKYLNPHDTFGELSFDEYCKRIPELYFKKEVPEDVIKNFYVVEKLLALSYYEYKFIDEAFAKALYTFEMAMGIRYKECFPDSKKITFNNLIKELSILNLFDTDIEILKRVKDLRNHYAHPERHSFAGVVFWNRIQFIVRLINEMYEDVNLRLERRQLVSETIEKLQNSKLTNALVINIKGELTILYRLRLLFVNNKQTPHSYLFTCTPLFDLQADEDSIKAPFSFKSKLINVEIFNDILTGTSFTAKEKVILSPINQHNNLLPIFEKWNSEFQEHKNKFQFELTMDTYTNDILIPELQEFQKL